MQRLEEMQFQPWPEKVQKTFSVSKRSMSIFIFISSIHKHAVIKRNDAICVHFKSGVKARRGGPGCWGSRVCWMSNAMLMQPRWMSIGFTTARFRSAQPRWGRSFAPQRLFLAILAQTGVLGVIKSAEP